MSDPIPLVGPGAPPPASTLTGAEIMLCTQGGNSRTVTTARIVAEAGGPTSGTYIPTLTDTTGQLAITTAAPSARIRQGAAAGSIVQAFLPLIMSGTLDGETVPEVTITLPVLPDEAGTFCVIGIPAGGGLTASVTALGMTLAFSAPPGDAGPFGPFSLDLHVTYQAAAAA